MGISCRQIRVNAKECSRTPRCDDETNATKPLTSFIYLVRGYCCELCFGSSNGIRDRVLCGAGNSQFAKLRMNTARRNPARKQTTAEHDETPTNENSKTLNKPNPSSFQYSVGNLNNIEIIFSWDIDYTWDIVFEILNLILVLRYKREILIAREI